MLPKSFQIDDTHLIFFIFFFLLLAKRNKLTCKCTVFCTYAEQTKKSSEEFDINNYQTYLSNL